MAGGKEWSCPETLMKYARNNVEKSVNIDPWDFVVSKESFVCQFVDDFLQHGRSICETEKAYKKWIFEKSKYLADTLQYNVELTIRAIRGECSPSYVLEQHTSYKKRNKRIFDDITSHHMNLKAEGWTEVIDKPGDLYSYAQAADAMGQKPWVVAANQWMETFVLDYFCAGGKHTAKSVSDYYLLCVGD